MTRALMLVLAVAVIVLPSTVFAEPPAIERLFPPGGQLGTEVEVTVTGKAGTGDLQVWSEQQALSVALNEKRDKATIRIPSDARPGIHWLRFYNEHGATDLKPFFVGTVPESIDTEPNNELVDAQKIGPGTINGVLHTTGEVDLFKIDLEAGQTLSASVQANRELGSPMDGVLEILDPNGTEIVSNDDDHGNDPLATIVAPHSGTYFVRLFAFPAAPNSTIRLHGAANYVYRLTVLVDPDAKVSPGEEQVPEQPTTEQPTTEQPTAELAIPWTATGIILLPGESDEFTFAARKDQNVSIRVAARANFSHLDPVAVLKTEAGKVIKEFDDTSGSDPDVSFSIVLPEDGRYVLLVKDRFDHGGDRYDYVVDVQENIPTFTSTVAANTFVLATDKPLEIPVAISRQHGFAERIAVSVQGLPEGISAAPVYSEKEGDSSKSVTLKIERGEAATAFSGVVRIVSESESSNQTESATAPKPNSKDRTAELWLTVTTSGG